jgi:DNA-binding SARP family transcriptional activator
MARLSVRMLGALQVTLDGTPLTGFESDKERVLLAYLVEESQLPHRREKLAGLLWPERPESAARSNLRRVLSNLRRLLGDRIPSGPPFLLVTEHTVRLNPTCDAWVDSLSFAGLLRQLRQQPGTQLEDAIRLYQGDFLEGLSVSDSPACEEWILLCRERYQRLMMEALHRLVEAYGQQGSYARALELACRQLELEPWWEEAHQQLIRLLALSGHRSDALAQYEKCRRVLAEELDAEPSLETTGLYEQIRDQRLAAPLPSSQRWQGPTHNLPLPLGPFVGRIDEIDELSRLLLDPGMRLLTILAPGGMGKSRLAIEIAQKLMPQFEDGVLFVPLAPLESSEMFLSYFANAIGYIRTEGQPLNQQLTDYFRGKSMLLILDNLEHLIDISLWIKDLLAHSPNLKIFATSRIPLNIKAETRFHLRGLNFPQEGTTQDLISYSAVELFLQSTHRVQPLFKPATDDWQYIGQICRLVGGMPLAIEMAASWFELLSLPEIVEEIRSGFTFFTTDIRDIPERQQSLYTVFDYSWKMLKKIEGELFCQLSIFRGGFTREAAEKVVGLSLRQLVGFVNRSLLNRTPENRFEIHELLRQYGFEKLQANPVNIQILKTRYAEYYCHKMGAWNEDMKTGNQYQAMVAINADFENIRHAWEIAVDFERLDLIETSLGSLIWYSEHSFRYDEGLSLFELAAENISGETRQGVRILSWLTGYLMMLNFNLGNLDQAEQKFQESLILMRRLEPIQTREDKYAQAFHFYIKGLYNQFQGDRSEFDKLCQQSIHLFRELGEDWWCERIYRQLGDINWNSKIITDTIDVYFQEALKIARKLNDHYGMARTLEYLGVFCAYSKGDLEKAESYLRESSRIFLELEYAQSYNKYLECLEQIANINGRFQEVLELRQKRLHLEKKLGYPTRISQLYMELGETYHHIGDYASAEMNGWRSVMSKGGLKAYEVRSRWLLSLTLIAKKDYHQAFYLLSEAMEITCELPVKPELEGVLAALIRVEIANGNNQIAERLLIEGLEEAIVGGYPFNMLYILASAALLLAVQGDIEKALEVYSLVHSWAFVSNSVWFSDVYKEPLLSLSGTEEMIVKERQPKDILWQMADSLLAQARQT